MIYPELLKKSLKIPKKVIRSVDGTRATIQWPKEKGQKETH
jgi:hypothetical protein